MKKTKLVSAKPDCQLIGEDSNVFNLIGKAKQALTRAGLREEAKTLLERAFQAHSYSEAINIIGDYVNIV